MVDISMCSNEDCKLKGSCYRYLAQPSNYQTYGLFCPSTDNHCEYYWGVSNEDTVELLNKQWRD